VIKEIAVISETPQTEIIVGKKLCFKGVVLPEGKARKPIGDWTQEADGGDNHQPFFKDTDTFREWEKNAADPKSHGVK